MSDQQTDQTAGQERRSPEARPGATPPADGGVPSFSGIGLGCGTGCLSFLLVALIMLAAVWLMLHVVIPMSFGQAPDLSLGLPGHLVNGG